MKMNKEVMKSKSSKVVTSKKVIKDKKKLLKLIKNNKSVKYDVKQLSRK